MSEGIMKIYRYILSALAVLCAFSCNRVEVPENALDGSIKVSPVITASCVMDGVNTELPYMATRSLIDQVTTQSMQANFIRVKEDVAENNSGLYTFTGGGSSPVPYSEVNWERSYLLEASVISSPDNTPDIYYRSISFDPVQSYDIIVQRNALSEKDDTTQFYHTRMVGWYPQNCTLQRTDKGKAVVTLFDDERFDGVRSDEVMIDGRPRVGISFSNLDGSKDVMVSNVKEAQHWHHHFTGTDIHPSDVHPVDGSDIYRTPFGHNATNPYYSNYFTYKHYLSAVRVWVYADQSSQNLNMWGKINNVVFQDQPTSCKIWLPEAIDTEWGGVYEWGNNSNISIITTPMFGDDVNHSDESYSASYPVTLTGAGDASKKIYLGYALVKPNSPLELELHTTNGVYVVDVASTYIRNDDTEDAIFDAGYVYDVMLNLKTDGTIAVLLENESNEHYYDLTTLSELEVGGEKKVQAYKYANCYIVSPNDPEQMRLDTLTNTLVPYDGFCFSATTVGNGQSGIISYGSQQMYPSSATINPSYAQLVWESSLGLVADVELLYGYVRFRVPDPNIEGNAVIAVYDSSNKLLWSWHIWITDMPADQTFTVSGTDYKLMDRNLGATASTWSGSGDVLETYGLYYQWGRKDPSMGPPSYNYSQINLMCAPYYDFSSERHTSAEVKQIAAPTMRDGVENPMYLVLPTAKTQSYEFNWLDVNNNVLWGCVMQGNDISVVKTIYDPCPFGYRVPASELNTLFDNSNSSRVNTDDTYGHIRRSSNGTLFYFPYAGYKGVDRGLNSIVGEWKYVGRKGDYQSSTYGIQSGNYYMHRSRIYISSSNSWSESGSGSYDSYVTTDYTNRRTATSIRCVKNENYGVVTSGINLSSTAMTFGGTFTISTTAKSSESQITRAKLERKYKDLNGTELVEVLYDYTDTGASEWANDFAYTAPDEATFSRLQDNFEFVFTVTNDLGVTSSSSATATLIRITTDFSNWIDVANPLVGENQPVVGQPVTLSVGIVSSVQIAAVTINDATANPIATPTFSEGKWRATYQLTTQFGTSEIKSVPVAIRIDGGGNVTINRDVPVWGITLGSAITSTSGFVSDTYYVMQNNTYSDTYVALNAAGTSLAAQTALDYATLFTLNTTTSRISAYNVKKMQWVTGTSSFSFNRDSGTNYYFRNTTMPIRIRTNNYGSTYWRQSSETAVSLGTTNSGRYWNFYPVTFTAPQ